VTGAQQKHQSSATSVLAAAAASILAAIASSESSTAKLESPYTISTPVQDYAPTRLSLSVPPVFKPIAGEGQ
jgi:hypothetical protein